MDCHGPVPAVHPFAGKTEQTLLGLGGSMRHLLRRQGNGSGLWKTAVDVSQPSCSTRNSPNKSRIGGPALERLDHGQLLWLAMHESTEEEVAALQETLELGDRNAHRLREHREAPPWPMRASACT